MTLVLPWWYWLAVVGVAVASSAVVILIVLTPLWLRVQRLKRANRRAGL